MIALTSSVGLLVVIGQVLGSFASNPGALPLADRSRRSFRAGVTPEYQWVRDASVQCTRILKSNDVRSTATAMQLCEREPSCEVFVYSAEEGSAELCRGLEISTVRRASGLLVGIKPKSLAIPSAAVLTNQHAICSSRRILGEFPDVKSVDEAFHKCVATPGCSHFSLDFAGSRSTPSDKQRLVLCSGDAVAVPREGAVSVVLAAHAAVSPSGSSPHAKSTNFLATRVLPVDGYKVRNSLFLSQLLRTPAAAAVNVLENEDAARMLEEAKYKAMEGQSSRLDHNLEKRLLLLAAA